MPQAYERYLVMREMGWTYQELLECPADIYADIIRFTHTEAVHQAEQRKRT